MFGLGTWERLSLLLRMVAALLVLVLVTVPIALTALVTAGFLGWFALASVGVLSAFFIPTGATQQLPTQLWSYRLPIILVFGTVLFPVIYINPVREEIRRFRCELGTSGSPAAQSHPELEAMAGQLAQQADIPEPSVFVADRHSASSYAVGGRSDGTIVLTRGLIRALDEAELRGVLAHEISHLRNGDSRIMGLALLPTLIAEHVGSDEPPDTRWLLQQPLVYIVWKVAWAVLTVVTEIQRRCGQFSVAVLSREREFAADRGAAALTGDPGALASALRTLTETRSTPTEDLRTWTQSATVLDILPTDDSEIAGFFRTHPDTERRIERLEQLAVAIEQAPN